MTEQDPQDDTLQGITLWDEYPGADSDSEEEESLDIDLDDIFQNLAPPESRKQQIARRPQTLPDTGALAQRAFGHWQKKRRVLFIHRRRCQHCHTIHTLPNDRVLTEYRHARNRSQSWASAGPGDLSLHHEVEYLDGKPLEYCQHCFGQPTEDPENPESLEET